MYDAIVIGNDLSSLIAAITAARNGLDTALLSERDIPDVYSEAGYTFNLDPFPLSGFGDEQVCERLFAKLDIPSGLLSGIERPDPAFQIILPEHRVELFHDTSLFFKEMRREFPEQEDTIRKYYSTVFTIGDLISHMAQDNSFLFPRDFQPGVGRCRAGLGSWAPCSRATGVGGAPFPEGLFGSLDCLIDLSPAAERHLSDRLVKGGVHYGADLRGLRFHPFATDVVLESGQAHPSSPSLLPTPQCASAPE